MTSWTEPSLELHKLALTNEQNLESKHLDLSAGFPNYELYYLGEVT